MKSKVSPELTRRFPEPTANELKQAAVNYVIARGGLAWVNNVGRALGINFGGPVGSGDVIGLYRGKFLSIEVKVGKDRLTEKQIEWMSDVNRRGGVAFLANSMRHVEEVIEAIK